MHVKAHANHWGKDDQCEYKHHTGIDMEGWSQNFSLVEMKSD